MRVRQLRGDRARRDHRRADVVRLDLLAQPFGDHAHGVLGRRVDRAAGADLVAGDRRDVDDVPGLLLLHVRQRRGDAVEHALDVDVDHPVPVVDLEALERRLRHQPGVVDHHVDAPVRLHGRVDQPLHLVAVGDVRRDGERLAAAAVNSSASDWRRSTRRAPSTTLAPSAESCRAVASPSPLLAPVMTTTFPRCYCPYCSSLTCSIQSTALPSSCS